MIPPLYVLLCLNYSYGFFRQDVEKVEENDIPGPARKELVQNRKVHFRHYVTGWSLGEIVETTTVEHQLSSIEHSGVKRVGH